MKVKLDEQRKESFLKTELRNDAVQGQSLAPYVAFVCPRISPHFVAISGISWPSAKNQITATELQEQVN